MSSTSSIKFLLDELCFHLPTAAVGMAPNWRKLVEDVPGLKKAETHT
jgi:hypothetical protein